MATDLNIYIGNKIRAIRKSRHLTAEQLANKLGVSRATVTRYETGIRNTNQDILFKLSDVLEVSIDDFFPATAFNRPTNVEYLEKHDQHIVRIPIIQNITDIQNMNADISGYVSQLFVKEPQGKFFAYYCKDDSMAPIIPKGALVTIKEQKNTKNDKIAAVYIDDDDNLILRRIKRLGNQLMLMAENQKYDPILLNDKNIIGQVIKVSYEL